MVLRGGVSYIQCGRKNRRRGDGRKAERPFKAWAPRGSRLGLLQHWWLELPLSCYYARAQVGSVSPMLQVGNLQVGNQVSEKVGNS